MAGLLKRNRQAIEARLSGTGIRKYYSPVLFGLVGTIQRRIGEYASGRLLDAGCGQRPYEYSVLPCVSTYDTVDLEKQFAGQTFVSDIQEMPVVASTSYDTVLCSEVLEHLPRPRKALAEIHRVLKDGGVLILSVPFLGRLHEEPHDYYRYTVHGLRHLLESSGFKVRHVDRIGSLAGFTGHQVSTLLVSGTWHIPGLRWLTFGINAALVTLPCAALDRFLGSDKLPAGYVVVAQKVA